MPAVYKLIEKLNKHNIDTDVVFISHNYDDVVKNYKKLKIKELKNINFYLLPYVKPILPGLTYLKLRHLFRFYNLIRCSNYDLIYCDRVNVEYGGIFSKIGYKVILRLHGVAFLNSTIKPLKKSFFPSLEYYLGYKSSFSSVICSIDGSPCRHFIQSKMKKNIKSYHLLNGVDEFKKTQSPINIRERYKLNSSTKIILSVGRISFDKSPQLLLESLIKLKKINYNFFAIFVGSGPLLNEMQNVVIEKNLQKNIIFIGSVPHKEIDSFLLQSDIFVSLNLCGNLSNAVLEAINYEKCIIKLDFDKITKRDEHLTDEKIRESFVLIKKEDIYSSLHLKIDKILNNKDILNSKINKIKILKEKYLNTWDDRIDKELSIINETVKT